LLSPAEETPRTPAEVGGDICENVPGCPHLRGSSTAQMSASRSNGIGGRGSFSSCRNISPSLPFSLLLLLHPSSVPLPLSLYFPSGGGDGTSLYEPQHVTHILIPK
jgi:hypothetical protein